MFNPPECTAVSSPCWQCGGTGYLPEMTSFCTACGEKDQRIEALEKMVKLADKLINGEGTNGGLVWCMDGYYGDCFTDDLKEWDHLMEQNYDN